MNKGMVLIVCLIIAGGLLATMYYKQYQADHTLSAIPQTDISPEAPQEPAIRFPIPGPMAQPEGEDTVPPETLPSLENSDGPMQTVLSTLFDPTQIKALFNLEQIIQRLVVTIDNIPRDGLPRKHLPLKPPGGRFLPSQDATAISPDNYRRYTPYVLLLESVDSNKLISTYIHYYPLFQQAYQDLGYPKGYFNDRLITVIDHLLATPDTQDPILLIRPNVLYLYADPELEALSGGQKLLLRTGPENALRIKAKLRSLRSELTDRIQHRTGEQETPAAPSPPSNPD